MHVYKTDIKTTPFYGCIWPENVADYPILVFKITAYEHLIAEHSEANNCDLWSSKSQLVFIYVYIYIIHLFVMLSWPWGQSTCSKWCLW